MKNAVKDHLNLETCGNPKNRDSFHAQARRAFVVLSVLLVTMQVYTSKGFFRAIALSIDCENTVANAAGLEPQKVVVGEKYVAATVAVRASPEGSTTDNRDSSAEEEEEEQTESMVLGNAESVEDESESRRTEEEPESNQAAGGSEDQTEEQGADESTSNEDEVVAGQEDGLESASDSAVAPIGSTSIREWGCGRKEAPFIFVHIGKAGGGGVRARLAASALDYDRSGWFRQNDDKSYYYPMVDDQGVLHKGKLENSAAPNFLPRFEDEKNAHPFTRTFAFEGQVPCHATTPLGHAIACPMEKKICAVHRPNATERDNPERCDVVYLGHNAFGSEMHWLPTTFLSKWWNQSMWAHDDAQRNPSEHRTVASKLANRFDKSHRVFDRTKGAKRGRFCPQAEPEKQRGWYNQYYDQCMYPETELADTAAQTAVANHENWGPVYASLPVLRVTMLREPFSWLKSKFFWQDRHISKYSRGIVLPFKGQDKMERAKKSWGPVKQKEFKGVRFVHCDDVKEMVLGWGKQYALDYMVYLCGENCMGRWQSIAAANADNEDKKRQEELRYLPIMEEQAAYNLRNSFAVVGLLTETPEFFDMISKRVDYMDTTLNPQIKGETHSSGSAPEMLRCNALYKEEAFRKEIMDNSPEIDALVRLYHIGIEVNKFQKQELEQCSA